MSLSILCLFFVLGIIAQSPSIAQPNSGKSNPGVLVELFTSEGCSSCPPADALLRKLDSIGSISGTQIVVLGEHVDYWDHQGWRDRFSSHEYTERQEEYARRFHTTGPYTPEMVVDGSSEFLGSDGRKLEAALKEAASQPKASLSIASASADGNQLTATIQAGPLPEHARHADLYIAIADNTDETQIGGGENSGKHIEHTAVARNLQKVAKVGPEGMQKEVKLRLGKSVDGKNLRLIAFLQEADEGKVLGSTLRVLNSAATTP